MGFIRDEDREALHASYDSSKMNRISIDEYFERLNDCADELARKLIDRWREGYVQGLGFDRNVYVSFLPATIVVDSRGQSVGEVRKDEGRAILRSAIDRILPDAEPYKVFLEPKLIRTVDEHPGDDVHVSETGHIMARLYVYP